MQAPYTPAVPRTIVSGLLPWNLPRTAGFAVLYAATIVLARPFEVPAGPSPWYPAAGVLLAWLMIDGIRVVGIALAVRVAFSFLVHHTDGGWVELGGELLTGLAVVGVYGVAAWSGTLSLAASHSVQRFTRFTVLAVFPAALASGLASGLMTRLVPGGRTGSLLEFFVGDALGALVAAPLLLTLVGRWEPVEPSHSPAGGGVGPVLQMIALTVPPATAAFAQIDGLFIVILAIGLTPITWFAVRRSSAQLSIAIVLVTTSAAVAARIVIARGPGTFDDLLIAQTLMLTATVIARFVNANHIDDLQALRRSVDAERQVTWTATHDPVTGALNREGLVLLADDQRALSRVVIADLGLSVRALRVLGQRFSDELDLLAVARLSAATGGQSVALLHSGLLGTVSTAAVGRSSTDLDSLHASLAAPIIVEGVELRPRPSLGIAAVKGVGRRAVEEASFAASLARARGVPWIEFDGVIEDDATEMRSRLADLQRAIGAGEITAWYQPIVTMEDQRIVGVEALARWSHPTLGVLAAGDFIELAEAAGLVSALGREIRTAVLEYAAELLPQLDDEQFRFAINVSPSELGPEFVDDLLGSLTSLGIDPHRFTVEVTEATANRDLDGTRDALERIRAAGVAVSIDDFGTGHATIAQLYQLPFDEIKVDALFVGGLPAARDMAVVRSICSIAEEFAFTLIAEGVETEEQLAALHRIGVDRVQGFVTGGPVPADELSALLSGQRGRRTS